jgi:hypothetical protein
VLLERILDTFDRAYVRKIVNPHRAVGNSQLKTLFVAAIVVVLLVACLTFVPLSISSGLNKQIVSVSVTIVTLNPDPLNFNAYNMQGPGTATINLSYSLPLNEKSGIMDNGSVSASRIYEDGNVSYLLEDCNLAFNVSVNCGIEISQSESLVSSSRNATIFLTVIVLNETGVDGIYALFPPDTSCGTYIMLIVGNQIPASYQSLAFHCPLFLASQITRVWVTGITNMTGLYLSTAS